MTESKSSVSVRVSDTQVSGARGTCAATPGSTTRKRERGPRLPAFLCQRACRNLTPVNLPGCTMSAGVNQLSTDLLLGIIPAPFNSVVRTTTECCFCQSNESDALEKRRSEYSPNLSLAPTQPVQVRSMRKCSCHSQTCIQTRTSRHVWPP